MRKRDIVDDLKEFIKRYEFYDDECHRLWKDYEELEAKYEKVVIENETLKDKCVDPMLENADYVWDEIARETAKKKTNKRRWRVK
ncbi:hypothetical protein HPA16_08400 [Streptococcus suis]|nr:hypothetical protein [Streptococcus suis]